ncbi:Cytochrome P450 4c3 [Eumeta japonica]|uniref:Cytochrome P450 4c3 n=1 Tax=Eumeta variegata TaxID=151549 RepID=A0A4C1SFP6_EUMVA|nr:Cytochrome P450 4c3 [Eumeta japonica]
MKESEKIAILDEEEDFLENTKLSVIDRFILSKELNYEELLNETFTVFTSSQEASAKISAFLLLMMAYHPEYQEKLYKEIISVMGTTKTQVSQEDLRKMVYLDMVYKEVLRLFPIGALIQRTVMEDIEISSGMMPAGCSLVAPLYHILRDARFWERPDEFDPERFNLENTKKRQPNCFIPFSLGPMDCLGRYYGTKLIKTLCVQVLRHYRLSSQRSYRDLRLVIAVSVAPVDDYKLILTPRDESE